MNVLLLLSLVLGQNPKAKLKEAIEWLCAYTSAHGRRFENGAVTQTTQIHSVQECMVRLAKDYLPEKNGITVKHETVYLDLERF